jgi:phosphohistidine swiveling domain-containing protein
VLVCATFSLEHEFGLLRGVRGMVTEDSPLLPTAMTVARELGLPVVAGLGATIDTIRDGQAVFVDGGAGTVEIIG